MASPDTGRSPVIFRLKYKTHISDRAKEIVKQKYYIGKPKDDICQKVDVILEFLCRKVSKTWYYKNKLFRIFMDIVADFYIFSVYIE